MWLTVVRQTLHGPLRQLSSVTRPLHLRLPRSTSTSWHELPIRNSPRSVPLGVRLTNADAKGGAAGALIGSNQFPKAGVNQCHGEDPLPVLETERAYRSRAVERVGFERDGNRPFWSVVVISRSPHEHLERRTFTVDAIEKCDVGADKVECNGSLRGEQVQTRRARARRRASARTPIGAGAASHLCRSAVRIHREHRRALIDRGALLVGTISERSADAG